jgi:putative hydrolase of the HAD superfamily
LLAAIDRARGWYWSDPQRHRQGRMNMQSARRAIVRLAFEKLGLEKTEIADELADAFTQQREELVRPFPGAVETLQALRERGVRMGLITNGMAQFQRRKIERFGLAPFFELIQIESEFGEGKPEPGAFLHALRCLDAVPGQAWMVGDDLEYDIRPSQALGMGTVWVDHSGKGLPQGCTIQPAWIVKQIAELVD